MEPIVLIHGYSAEGKDSPDAIPSIYGSLPQSLKQIYGGNAVVEIDLSAVGARSSRRICGTSCAGRRTKSSIGYSRRARPGPVRPARPARWLALAWLTRAT